MAVRQYIGARYVPVVLGDWVNNRTYEPLSVVNFPDSTGASYTSKKFVPAGIEPTNGEYWALTGAYNAQVTSLQNQVNTIQTKVDNIIPNPDFVTPQEFGAIGDGVTDDTLAMQAAFDAGVDVYIPEGTYKISNKLSVSENTTISGVGSLLDVRSVGASLDGLIDITEANVTIKDISINMEGVNQALNIDGIIIKNTNNVIIDNVTVTNNFAQQSCIECYNSSDVIIKNCTIKDWKNIAISCMNDSKNVKILNNTVVNRYPNTSTNTYGIVCASYHSPYPESLAYPCSDVLVDGNYIDVEKWEAIDAHGGLRLTVVNNKVYTSDANGIAIFSALNINLKLKDINISNNNISCASTVNDHYAIMADGYLCNVIGNIINNFKTGISPRTDANWRSKIIISGNSINSCYTGIGDYISSMESALISNNLFNYNTIGISLGDARVSISPSIRVLISDNTFNGNTTPIKDSELSPNRYHNSNCLIKCINNHGQIIKDLTAAVADYYSGDNVSLSGQRGDIVKRIDASGSIHGLICTRSSNQGEQYAADYNAVWETY